jgi:lysophospholipase L1-like esterase
MATVTTGNSATITLNEGLVVTITTDPNTTGTVARTFTNDGNDSQTVTEAIGPPAMNSQYGPYDRSCSLVITSKYGTITYTILTDLGIDGSNSGLKYKNIGTRIPFCRMGTFSNATAKTFNVTAEAACHFDAARPIFGSYDAARSYQMSVVKMSCPSACDSDAAMLNNSGTWVQVSQNGQNPIPLKTSIGGSTTARIVYTLPDFIQLSSVDRTDGGTLPLITIRCYSNDTSATAWPCYGDGSEDDVGNWTTRTSRKWFARQINGDGVSTPTNFTGGTSATPQIQSPIIGFQYLSRGTVVTVCGIGDSIMDGRGTYKGEGYVLPACEAIQDETPGLAIEYMNLGYAGQPQVGSVGGINGFCARALDILNDENLRPDVIVYAGGSPNDQQTTLSASGVAIQMRALQTVIQEAKRRGVALVIVTWMPTNYAVYPRGSTDSLRVTHNETVLEKFKNVYDISTDNTSTIDENGQWTMIYAGDGIHPSDAGNAVFAAGIKPYLLSAIYGG